MEMLELTADQVEKIDLKAAGWTEDILIRLANFPEIEGRPMVFQRDAYQRGPERLVIEWGRNWNITALARNGRWVEGNLTWEILVKLLQDELLTSYDPCRVVDAPGYADFDGWVLFDSIRFPSVVVECVWEGKRDIAVVPRACVKKVGK